MLLSRQGCHCLGRDAGQGCGHWPRDAEQWGRDVIAWAGMQESRNAEKLEQG